MAFPQQKLREIIFQILFSLDMSLSFEEEAVGLLMEELAVSKRIIREAQAKAAAIWQKKEEIDPFIQNASQEYDFERIQRAERNILRLGIYELYFEKEIPPKVVIAEAIRLSRKFSTPESASFVNAVLDTIYQKKAEAS